MKPASTQFIRSLLVALAAATLLTGCGKDGGDDQPDQIYEVVRGDFNIVITANGVLDAVKRYIIEAPPVSKQGLDIIEAVEDQTVLKKGDQIVAFSDETYLDELEDQTIKIEEAEKNLMILQQDYQMKIADIVSAIKAATDAHRISREALEKYVSEDAPLAKKNFQQDLAAARQDVEDEEQNLASLKASLLSASMGDEAARLEIEEQVENSEMQSEELESNEEKASYDLRIFKQYTFPQQSRKLEQDQVRAEMDLQKELVNSAAQRLQIERKIQTQERLLHSLKQQKRDLLENIAMLKVTAPVNGAISYGDPNPRRHNQQQKEIVVGAKMNRSEIIGSIPDLSRLVVNVDIPEISRSKIDPGMRAEMRIKALPNLRLSGVVEKVSDLATSLVFWDRSSPKIYPTIISLEQNDPSLRPGMTVEVDMISEVISSVLFVPVEALFVKEGDVYCQVKKAVGSEARKVVIGRSSSSYVEILEGLEEGDRVLLSREEL
ncbi:MAG: HlyD family efflux transporter periplasmic adaptor subunit [Kiritimatiellales bacterium]|nr:HlyD family efflux transporter periplasmic adaptor subunit [Kiritimatiellota bacterium]MBL7012294.1 HlyD family efflux transporter periplasmic adaptor subunit [Kiritimatiellales bacterium]